MYRSGTRDSYMEGETECWIPVNLQATTENSSLSALLDFILNLKKKNKKKNLIFPFIFLSFPC